MVSPQILFIEVFTLFFLLVDGSTEPFRVRNLIIESTKELPDSSGNVKKSGNISSSNVTSYQDRIIFDSLLCGFETCLSLCCDTGMARLDGSCIKKSEIMPQNITFTDHEGTKKDLPKPYQLFANDPCNIGWMRSSIEKNFDIFKNGSVYVPDYEGGSILSFKRYCLLPDPKSAEYLVKVCRPWLTKGYYEIICLIIIIIIMLTMFIGYTIIPELKTPHGLIFRCYVITSIGLYISSLGAELTTEKRSYAYQFTFCDMMGRYLGFSCTLWVNVMCFKIWRSFRSVTCNGIPKKKREAQKFIRYAIFAWGIPAVLVMSFIIPMNCLPYFYDDIIGDRLKLWTCVGFGLVILSSNMVLYASTALNIRQRKIETAILVEGVNKHYETEKQWYNLCLKLFPILGVHMIVWIIWLIWPNAPGITQSMITLEVMQGILLFWIFLWKDNVKRSLCERFS